MLLAFWSLARLNLKHTEHKVQFLRISTDALMVVLSLFVLFWLTLLWPVMAHGESTPTSASKMAGVFVFKLCCAAGRTAVFVRSARATACYARRACDVFGYRVFAGSGCVAVFSNARTCCPVWEYFQSIWLMPRLGLGRYTDWVICLRAAQGKREFDRNATAGNRCNKFARSAC